MKLPLMAAAAVMLALLTASVSGAEPVRSRSAKLWSNQSDCWATVYPIVRLITEEIGPSRVLVNSDDEIEHEIADVVTGRPLLRVGCVRVPGRPPALFRRYIEFP